MGRTAKPAEPVKEVEATDAAEVAQATPEVATEEKVETKGKKTLTVEVMSGVNAGLVRTFEKGEEDAAESFKAKFNGRYI